jgi:hypothetical protein
MELCGCCLTDLFAFEDWLWPLATHLPALYVGFHTHWLHESGPHGAGQLVVSVQVESYKSIFRACLPYCCAIDRNNHKNKKETRQETRKESQAA